MKFTLLLTMIGFNIVASQSCIPIKPQPRSSNDSPPPVEFIPPEHPPSFEELAIQAGKALVKQGEYEAAAQKFTEAYDARIEANLYSNGFKDLEAAYVENEALAWRDVGYELSLLQQNAEAIKAYQRAIAIDSTYGRLYQGLALVLERDQQLSKAAETYMKAGDTMVSLYMTEKINAYQDSIRLNPNNPKAHNELGEAYLIERNIPAARSAFRAALEIDPNYVEAQKNLEQLPIQTQ